MSQNTVLTNEEKVKLSQAFDDLISWCMYQQLYNHLVSNGTSITFVNNPNRNTAAGYNPETNTIQFKGTSNMIAINLAEELFHAYQNSYYPEGLSISTTEGRADIEFEAKVFGDIECSLRFGICGSTLGSEEYDKWIIFITDNYSSIPSWDKLLERSPSTGNKNYWDFLFDFSRAGIGYNYTPTYQIPNAMIYMLQQSSNSNCY